MSDTLRDVYFTCTMIKLHFLFVLVLSSSLNFAVYAFLASKSPLARSRRGRVNPQTLHASSGSATSSETSREDDLKELLQLLEATPSNAPTSSDFTNYILQVIRKLEDECPTQDQEVVSKLAGTWELLWTTQDTNSEQYNRLGPILNWIKYVQLSIF